MCDEMTELERQIAEITDKYLINVFINEKRSGKPVQIPEIKINNDSPLSQVIIFGAINFEKILIALAGGELLVRAILDSEINDYVVAKKFFRTDYIKIDYTNNILSISSRIGNLTKKFTFDEGGWQAI